MTTLNKLIYNLRKFIRDSGSDDLKFSDRQLEFIINYVRAKLIRNDINKGNSISDNIKSDLGAVKIKKVDSSESTSIPINRLVLRTERKLPKLIEFSYKDGITYVGGMDKMSPFQFSTKANVNWQQHSKFGKNSKYAYLRDSYMCLSFDTNSKWINIEGVFQDPREVKAFTNPTEPYNADVDPYPISEHMIQPMNELIVSKELNAYFQLREDVVNDASSEIKK